MNCTTCGLPVEPGSACCDDHHMYDEDCIVELRRGLAERDARVRELEAALRANVEFIKANGWTVPPDIEALAAARKETP